MERIKVAIEKARGNRLALATRSIAQSIRPGDETSPAWDEMQSFTPTVKLLQRNRVVTVDTADPSHIPYDMMRTRLLSACRKNGYRVVGITSPTPRCGKTLTAVNLAFALARQRSARTVLIDADLRQPGIASLIGLSYARSSMSAFLSGDGTIAEQFMRFGAALAVGVETARNRTAAEILMSKSAADAMQLVVNSLDPDIVLVDMPPMHAADDVMAFLPNVDAMLLVAAAEDSKIKHIDECERELAANTNLLGVVLNKCRYARDNFDYDYNYN